MSCSLGNEARGEIGDVDPSFNVSYSVPLFLVLLYTREWLLIEAFADSVA